MSARTTPSAVKRAVNNTPMIFGYAPQDVIDKHYRDIIEILQSKDNDCISFLLACLNYLKDLDGYGHIRFAAQNAVMHGWLSVSESNQFIAKEIKP